MNSPSFRLPGEATQRALAYGAAVVLPLLVAVLIGTDRLQGPGVLTLTLPVVLVAAFGGLGPGVLAIVVGALPVALRLGEQGSTAPLVWLAVFVLLGAAICAFAERAWRRSRRLGAEHETLRSDHGFQRAVTEIAGDFAWQGHLSGSRLLIDRATPGLQRAIGMTIDEVNARGGWGALVHADDQAAWLAPLKTLRAGALTSCELRYALPQGIALLQCDVSLLSEAESTADRTMVAVVRDVTARHELIEQLRESKERFESAVTAAGLLVLTVNVRDQRVDAAGNGHALLGNWPAELSGPLSAWLERVHPDDANRVARALRESAADRKPIALEYRMRHADGRTVTVEHRAEAVAHTEQPPRVRLVGFIRDVTAQRDAEGLLRQQQELLDRQQSELRQADRRKDEFLTTLAHELRNPLGPIRNASMLLALQDGSAQSIDWVRRVIDRQTDQLARLIDDLLDVSRIARDKLTLRVERVELARVIEAAVESLRSQIDAQRHQLKVEVPAGLWVQGDPVRLKQIVGNLLNNASKFTSPGGAIQVRAEANADTVTIAVRDNGVGIPADQLARVFDMFYHVDRSSERAHAGLGIGLTLVNQLVRLHGGEVSAMSEGIGRGSEFVVRLPLADEPTRTDAPRAGAGRSVRGLRILVADDSVDSALTLTALLSAAGHDVEVVHDGFTALQRAADFRPHVLVLDIGMPGLNGYDTCRRIRAEGWGRHAVVIAVTGWGGDEDRRRSREAGFDAHLVKPVDYTELQKHFSADNVPQ